MSVFNTTVRLAVPADYEQVVRLAAKLLSELSGSGEPDLEKYQVSTQKLLAEELVWAFLASSGVNPAIGLLTLYEGAAIYAQGRFGIIAELYVIPEMRSAGIAAKLVEQAMTFGRKRSWTRLEVSAPPRPRWDRTVSFYLAKGFSEGGPRLQRHIPGVGMDC